MFRIRVMLNILVVLIIVFMTALTAVFIYSSMLFKNKITIQIVRKTELVSELITRSVFDLMSAGHAGGRYLNVLSYGNILGVEDIAIFRLNGSEAFGKDIREGPQDITQGRGPRRIKRNEEDTFKKAVATVNSAGFFNWEDKTYSQYVPLRSEGACAVCHDIGKKPLGVLKIGLAAGSDLSLLNNLKDLIWALGVIVVLPLGALLLSGAIIREKNRLYGQLQDSNTSLKHTYDKLNETRNYLQMILDNSKVIIVTTDTDGRIVEFSREAEVLLEYRKEEIIGKDVLILYVNPEQRPEHMKRGRPLGDEIWAVRNRDVVMRSKSGKNLHVSLTLSTMLNEKGKIIGTVGVGKDVSEHRMLQFKLMQSEKLAGIGTLATGIAHEINNPLAGILGMAEAIRDEDDLNLIRSYTNDIIQYTVNASNIVRELSSYSRSVNSETRSTVDLSAIMENSLKMARHSSSFYSIELVTGLEKGCFVTANSGEMQQVFVNLIINSIHAMGDEGTLTLKCFKEGSFVKAVVEDTGQGIGEEHLTQIFDPFFTTKPVGKGTGLGLYVVYRIITRHEGSIDVDTEVGKGTRFTLRFPSSESSDWE